MQIVGNVHLVQESAGALARVVAALEASGIVTHGNPDLDIARYGQFRVDDARALVEKAQTKAVGGTRRVFVVITPNMLYEAQNTLLKTLEEPPGNALFFFIVPAPELLLSTVRSRAQIHAALDDSGSELDARAFLRATPAARLEILKPLFAKEDDDQPSGGRDISAALTFLSSLERILAKQPGEQRAGIEAVYRARKYIADKGSLLKALLEQIALLTPVVKS